MSSTEKPYRVVSVVQVNKWDNGLQTTVSGSEVKALWLATQGFITVFVPDTADLEKGSDVLIRARGEQLDRLHSATV